jgi:hypothetical protein
MNKQEYLEIFKQNEGMIALAQEIAKTQNTIYHFYCTKAFNKIKECPNADKVIIEALYKLYDALPCQSLRYSVSTKFHKVSFNEDNVVVEYVNYDGQENLVVVPLDIFLQKNYEEAIEKNAQEVYDEFLEELNAVVNSEK